MRESGKLKDFEKSGNCEKILEKMKDFWKNKRRSKKIQGNLGIEEFLKIQGSWGILRNIWD